MIQRNTIPATSRSKYYNKGSNYFSLSENGGQQVAGGGLPYDTDSSGNFIIANPTFFPSIAVGDTPITQEKVITWDEAVEICNNLKPESDALFNTVSVGDGNTKLQQDRLLINNNPIYAPLQIYNNQYGAGIRMHGTDVQKSFTFHSADDNRTTIEKNGYWTFGNGILVSNDADIEGETTTNSLAVIGDTTTKNLFTTNSFQLGTVRMTPWNGGYGYTCEGSIGINPPGNTGSLYSDCPILEINKWGDDINTTTQRMIFTNQNIWFVGTKIDTSCELNVGNKDTNQNLNVYGNATITGSFNCFELVANKVRSTNGMLYVTDSDVVKSIEGYDDGVGVWVVFEEQNFVKGDIFLIQTRTSNGIKSLKFKVGNAGSKPNEFYCERMGDTNVQDIKVNDYCVKIDSQADAFTIRFMYENNKIIEFDKYNYYVNEILVYNYIDSNEERKSKKIKVKYKPSDTSTQLNYYININNEWVSPESISDTSLLPKVGEMYYSESKSERNTGVLIDPNNGGYMDFYKGWGNGINKTTTTSIGNLKHLGIEGVEGEGIYSDNAYIRGKIYATDLQFDGTIDGNKINADSLVVRNLKTSETGVKIEASGHDLRMLDANDSVKLLVTGDKYSNLDSFVNSSGAGGNYNISIVSDSFSAFSGGGFVSEESLLPATSTMAIPSTGQYSLVIPSFSLNMSGYASVIDAGGSGTLNGKLLLIDDNNNVVKQLMDKTIIVDNFESSVNMTYEFKSTEIPVQNNQKLRLAVKFKFNGMVGSESRGSVNMSGKIVLSTINYIILQELTNNTTIFENGLGYKSSTTKYAVIINSDTSTDPVFQARNGNTIFRVASDGVYISDDAGRNWRKI